MHIIILFVIFILKYTNAYQNQHQHQLKMRFLKHSILKRHYSSLQLSNDQIQCITCNWISKWVIQQNLCPWAASVFNEEKMSISVLPNLYIGTHKIAIKNHVLKQAKNIINANTTFETSIIVFPKVKKFNDFLKLIEDIEYILEYYKIDDQIQIASFHPDYQFRGTDIDDVTNYTNRSPYPIIHLLYIPQVTKAINLVDGNTEFVWKNNIKKLQDLGLNKVLEIQSNIIKEVIKD